MRSIDEQRIALDCLRLAYSPAMDGWPAKDVRDRAATYLAFVTGDTAIDAAPEKPSFWQPIETAPRDGSDVLLATDSRMWIGCWYDTVETNLGNLRRRSSGWTQGYPIFRTDEPVWWAPIPDLPVIIGVDGGGLDHEAA